LLVQDPHQYWLCSRYYSIKPDTSDAEMRFLGINVATEYGGMGLGNLEALLVLLRLP